MRYYKEEFGNMICYPGNWFYGKQYVWNKNVATPESKLPTRWPEFRRIPDTLVVLLSMSLVEDVYGD